MDTFWNDPALATNSNAQETFDLAGFGVNTVDGDQQFTFDQALAPDFDFGSTLYGNNEQGQDDQYQPQHSTHHQPAQLHDDSQGQDFQTEGQSSAFDQQHFGHNGSAAQFSNEHAASVLQSLSGKHTGNMQRAYSGMIWDSNGMPVHTGLGQNPSPMASNGTSSTATNTPMTPTANTFQQSTGARRALPPATYTPEFMAQPVVQQQSKASNLAQPYMHNHVPHGNYQQQVMQQQYAQYPQYQPFPGQRSSGPLAYGSDDDFREGGFNGRAYTPNVDKGNNLKNVPLAELAAVSSRARTEYPENEAVYGAQQQTRQHVTANGQMRQYKSVPSPSTHHPHTQSFNNTQYGNNYQQLNYDMSTTVQPILKRSRHQMEDAPTQNTPPTARGKARHTTESYKTEPIDDDGDSPLPTPPHTTKRPAKRARVSAARADTLSSDTGSPATPRSGENAATAVRRRRSGARCARPNLSDEQKRKNHIASEQKRRNTMKQNFKELETLVPSLLNGNIGLSRAEVLAHAASFLETLMNCNDASKTSYTFDESQWRTNGRPARFSDEEQDAVAGAYDDGAGT
ncbi:hypothetical protein B0A48_06206 [Cryoendolithus antarcticus]|uniref:BHLH domain-containing protein n=1 Tax=Cryoendolithus antarcticus TaxID=1507870 RepID=A0A1V8TAB9_9PEZI|nr:hypothetical protein B0A48_06206 [Cryoendolithus antarcticus]